MMRPKQRRLRENNRIIPSNRNRETCPRCGGFKDAWDLHTYRKKGRWKVTPARPRFRIHSDIDWTKKTRQALARPIVRIRRKQAKCTHPFHDKVQP